MIRVCEKPQSDRGNLSNESAKVPIVRVRWAFDHVALSSTKKWIFLRLQIKSGNGGGLNRDCELENDLNWRD